ncbi:MAG: tail fiber domain-containing protein [Limisphaerales bacterium]
MKRANSTAFGCLLSAFLLHPCLLPAQTSAFTYQGRLDDGGAPANGRYDFIVTDFDAATDGSSTAFNLVTNIGVTNGLFTLALDLTALAFPGADRWLEISVRTNGGGGFTTLSPRQRVTSTPYAIFSHGANAAGLSGTIPPASIGSGSIASTMLAPGSVGTSQLADGSITASKMFTTTNPAPTYPVVTTFTNPTPMSGDYFGARLAVVGNDRVLIGATGDDTGATGAGAAYLFNVNGNLLLTITNPTPDLGEHFGRAVAALGSDRLVISAPQMGSGFLRDVAVYVFSTNGTLLTTITNPFPEAQDRFGYTVAVMEGGNLLVGAPAHDGGVPGRGAVYLFATNGTLLTTFTNPPLPSGYYGLALGETLVPWGNDRVLIGDSTAGGRVYLFTTNGNLVNIFTNPAPDPYDYFNNRFGESIVPVGNDRVLIGEPGVNGNIGLVYLFNTNGELLLTFSNPLPSAEYFGSSLEVVGDRIFIAAEGAYVGGPGSGAVYVFNTNGVLQATLRNPVPNSYAGFGSASRLLGNSHLLVGAPSGGAESGGVVHLIALTAVETYTPGLIAAGVRAGAITGTSLADNSVGSSTILDGSITVNDLDTSTFAGTFWKVGGNAGGANYYNDFLGTTDRRSLNFKVYGRDAMRFVPGGPFGNSTPNIVAGDENWMAPEISGASILGGNNNEVNSNISSIAGGAANEIHAYSSFIGGGQQNVVGNAATHSVVAGGQQNSVGTNSTYTVIGGGGQNTVGANSMGSTISGGRSQEVGDAAAYAAIGGGFNNHVDGGYAAIAGGMNNVAEGFFSTIGGGQGNNIAGGGLHATIPGGRENAATAAHTFAAGRRAKAVHQGSFVWGDSTAADVYSEAANSITCRASGGYWLYSNDSLTSGVRLNAGGTSWSVISDRNVKKDFAPINAVDILEKLAALPITQWHYKWENAETTPHIGPMAQDFKAAFYPGSDDQSITTQEADGVALAAIQGLNQKLADELKRRDAENAELKARLEKLEQLLNEKLNGGAK